MRKVGASAIATLFFIGLFGSLISGCGTKPTGEAAEVIDLHAAAGQRFKLVVDSNDRVGYDWKLAEPLNEDIVRFVDSEFQGDPIAGDAKAGYEIWTLEERRVG